MDTCRNTTFSSRSRKRVDPAYRQLITDLAEIEAETGIAFSLDSSDLTQGEFASTQRLLTIVRSGKISSSFKKLDFKADGFKAPTEHGKEIEFDLKLNRPKNPRALVEFILDSATEELFTFDMKSTAEVELFGATIPLGPEIMSLRGQSLRQKESDYNEDWTKRKNLILCL